MTDPTTSDPTGPDPTAAEAAASGSAASGSAASGSAASGFAGAEPAGAELGPRGDGTPGPVALVGSGEFLPVMRDVDGLLLEGRPRRVAVIPTASSLEGDDRVRWWLDLAGAHYGELDAEVIELDVRDRADADDPAMVDAIAGVGLVYLSGGNPAHLASVLRGSSLWSAIHTAWRGGAAVAGCSAGAMALASRVLVPRSRGGGEADGVGLVSPLAVVPHYDRYGRWLVGSRRIPADVPTVGVDEDTALVHGVGSDDGAWSVHGRSSVWRLDGGKRPFDPTDPIPTPG